MIRAFAALALLIAAGVLSGCRSTASAPTAYAPLVARFFLEAKRNEAGIPVTLPRSGLNITVSPRPVLVECDIVNAEVALLTGTNSAAVPLKKP